jgi:hypothetical protein
MARASVYLFITDSGLTIWTGPAGSLAQTAAFPADADGLAGFERFVDANREAHYRVLLDLQEEDYRAETLPHVAGRDRRRILGRRLEQLYRETPYRSATPQGREETGRRDDRVLLAALTNPKPIDQWLNRLTERDAQVVGIYSITLLTARHARQLPLIPQRALIVTRQFGSGLRQTYLSDGMLRFSRLTVPEEDSEQTLASQLAAEAARARQFLASLRAIDRLEAMQVAMICGEDELAALTANCPDSELIHYQFIPIPSLAKALGVSDAGIASTAEPVWLRFVATRHPSNQYATLNQRKPYLAWKANLGLIGLTVLTLAASVAAGSWYWQRGQALAADTAQQARRQTAAEQTYAANVPKTAEGELTPTGMKNVVLAYRQLVEQWPQLEPSMARVSAVLEQFPQAELEELAWQVSADPNALPTGFSDAVAAAPNAAPAGQAPVDANGNPAAPGRYIILAVKAKLPDYELRPRASLSLVDQIANAFASEPAIKVSKLELPIDTRPDKALDLSNANEDKDEGAPFALKIVIPLPTANPEPMPAPAGESPS